MTTNTNILLRNGYIPIQVQDTSTEDNTEALATVLMNLEYYGFYLSQDAYKVLSSLSWNSISVWWASIEPEFKAITGDDRNIGDFVVYKNFPAEVLKKSEAEYWIPQILMYWGFPNNLFTEEVKPREDMVASERKSKTLMLATPDAPRFILNSLLGSKSKWKDQELDDVVHLSKNHILDFSKVQFKENLINLAKYFTDAGIQIKVKTATDVLRLAAGLSDGDISLHEKVKFKSFNRKTRRFFMNMLQDCTNLREDVARRKGPWKKFLHNLHPGEFQKSHARVVEVADALYNDRLVTFSSRVETLIRDKDPEVFQVLASRPGEFMRRLVHLLDIFGNKTVVAFTKVIPKLSVYQIVTLRSFLEVTNLRDHRVFPPKGNWAKLQIGKPRPVAMEYVEKLSKSLGKELSKRIPKISILDPGVKKVKLPNGSEEGSYARGTVFKIPEDINFIRTASYWKLKSGRNIWFDNGWNFFGSNWNSMGACCWSDSRFQCGHKTAAIFSGDPTNSKEMQGRAAQLIDLYLSELKESGVKYAVWNILCFSGIPFSDAEDVFAALQWGKNPQKGKLFEPSRAQLAFPITGNYKTKYVCLIDLETREMIYLDANLKASVSSAVRNGATLSKQMPAYMEYLYSLPTVYDLFRESVRKTGKGQVIYSSAETELKLNQPAYVFSHESKAEYKPIDLNTILGS